MTARALKYELDVAAIGAPRQSSTLNMVVVPFTINEISTNDTFNFGSYPGGTYSIKFITATYGSLPGTAATFTLSEATATFTSADQTDVQMQGIIVLG